MENNWKISVSHQKTLDILFEDIKNVKRVLDVGSGRTSIEYLTSRFPNVVIQGIIYPGDLRKINPIKECVKNKNYSLIESDIKDFKQKDTYDVILAHLFLGEAEKFGENNFKEVCNTLFNVKTKYLVMENLFSDRIDYSFLLSQIAKKGKITKLHSEVSDSGDEYLGMTVEFYE